MFFLYFVVSQETRQDFKFISTTTSTPPCLQKSLSSYDPGIWHNDAKGFLNSFIVVKVFCLVKYPWK